MHFAKDVSPHSSSASYFFANSDPAVCAWLGRESLPCLSVRPAWHGPVLLISLCNGMGCAALALAAFGIHFSFVCVEPSSVFRQAVSSCFSNVLHFAHVPTFQPEHLPDGWRNFRFWLILVVGNARCSGPGANSVHHARRVANACSKIWSSACVWAICEGPCLPVKGCSLCPVGPVVTDAADWGRVSRWQD